MLKKLFARFDLNASGGIDNREMGSLLEMMGRNKEDADQVIFELDVDGLFLDSFKGRISTKFHAYWFDASEVKWFLRSLASIHHDHNSKKYEQQKLETNLKISESMTDNLWNAIQRTRDDGYVHEPNPYLEWIEIGFDGNFDSYFLHIKHWKNITTGNS